MIMTGCAALKYPVQMRICIIIINVYLLYECTDSHDMYMDYLSKIAVFTAGINSTCIFIVGDFNADLSKTSPFGSILCDFRHDNSFTVADKEYLPADT